MKKVFAMVTYTNNVFADYIIKNVSVRKYTGELVDLSCPVYLVFHCLNDMYEYILKLLKTNGFQPRRHVDFGADFYEIAWIDISYDPTPRYYAYNGR